MTDCIGRWIQALCLATMGSTLLVIMIGGILLEVFNFEREILQPYLWVLFVLLFFIVLIYANSDIKKNERKKILLNYNQRARAVKVSNTLAVFIILVSVIQILLYLFDLITM